MTTVVATTPDVEALRLYVDSIDAKPQSFDWDSRTNADFGDLTDEDGVVTWRYVEHRTPEEGDEATCDSCAEPITYGPDGWWHDDIGDGEDDGLDHDAEPDSDWHREQCDGPMMNYWYPVDIPDLDAAADKIAHLPLCAVQVGDETGIALTGGGMDFSWEICQAYIALGSYPPFHYVGNLPKLATTWRDEHELVVAAGRKVCQIMAEWAQAAAARLDDTADWMKNRRWIEDHERRSGR